MNAECLSFVKILKDVQPNSVPKLFVTGNVTPRGTVTCAYGFLQNVKMTCAMMMNGDVVFARDGPLDGVPCVSALEAASPVRLTLQATLIFFAAPSFLLTRDDGLDNWSIDAKLKLKVGVVSVTVEQNTEGRPHDNQSMFDRGRVQRGVSTFTCRSLREFLREGRSEIVFRQDQSCGQNLITAVLLGLLVAGRRCHLRSKCQSGVCVMLVFMSTPTLAVTVVVGICL